ELGKKRPQLLTPRAQRANSQLLRLLPGSAIAAPGGETEAPIEVDQAGPIDGTAAHAAGGQLVQAALHQPAAVAVAAQRGAHADRTQPTGWPGQRLCPIRTRPSRPGVGAEDVAKAFNPPVDLEDHEVGRLTAAAQMPTGMHFPAARKLAAQEVQHFV